MRAVFIETSIDHQILLRDDAQPVLCITRHVPLKIPVVEGTLLEFQKFPVLL